jgi:hypothetical protein
VKRPTHNLVELRPGETLADVLPVFADAVVDVHIGEPDPNCASCREPFTQASPRAKEIRVYPVAACQIAPIALAFDLCGGCYQQYQAGGGERLVILENIDALLDGDWSPR